MLWTLYNGIAYTLGQNQVSLALGPKSEAAPNSSCLGQRISEDEIFQLSQIFSTIPQDASLMSKHDPPFSSDAGEEINTLPFM